MSHLTLEALARLVDEVASSDEEAHLRGCAECREELTALREQSADLGTLPRLMPAPDVWPEVRKRLRADGLMAESDEEGRGGTRGTPRRPALTPVWRAAAAAALFLAGAAGGYMVRGAPAGPPPGDAAGEVSDEAGFPATAASDMEPGSGIPDTNASAGRDPAGTDLAAEPARSDAGFPAAADAGSADGFQLALDDFMANTPEAEDPAARLATLDNILLITAEALSEAPSDPVINGYYRTAVAQRNAILRQIESSRSDPVF